MSHITLARTKGASAGFKALEKYLASPLGASNPRMDEVREALTGNREARFQAYCGMYLSDGEIVQESAPAPRKPRKATPSVLAGDKPREWSAFWVSKKKLPRKVGATFTYTSKKYGTTSKHRVIAAVKGGAITTERVSITR